MDRTQAEILTKRIQQAEILTKRIQNEAPHLIALLNKEKWVGGQMGVVKVFCA